MKPSLALLVKAPDYSRGGKTQFIPVLSNTKALLVFLRKDGIISQRVTKWKEHQEV